MNENTTKVHESSTNITIEDLSEKVLNHYISSINM